MADIYLRSVDGDNANDGSTRALAKKTLEDGGMSSAGDGALTAAGAGGRVFAANDHAQTEAVAITLIGGTVNAPIKIISTDFSTNGAGVPDQLVGSSVTTTGVNSIIFDKYAYFYGVTITSGADLDFSFIGGNMKWIFDTCTLATAGSSKRLLTGTPSAVVSLIFLNTDLGLNGGSIENDNGRLLWIGGALTGVDITGTLFTGNVLRGHHATLRNVDLSILTGNLINVGGTTRLFHFYNFYRCKLDSGLSILNGTIQNPRAFDIKLHSCDSSDTTYNIIEEHYEGTIIDETTIVRTGGASDGATPISLKMTTNANAIEFVQPLVSPPIVAWTDKLVSTTFTIEVVHDSLTNLQDDEIWMEFEYGGADAQGDIANDKLSSILATPADQAASTVTWTTTGLTNPNKQKLSVTITPLKIGQVTARVYLAKPSYTIYVDPKIVES